MHQHSNNFAYIDGANLDTQKSGLKYGQLRKKPPARTEPRKGLLHDDT